MVEEEFVYLWYVVRVYQLLQFGDGDGSGRDGVVRRHGERVQYFPMVLKGSKPKLGKRKKSGFRPFSKASLISSKSSRISYNISRQSASCQSTEGMVVVCMNGGVKPNDVEACNVLVCRRHLKMNVPVPTMHRK